MVKDIRNFIILLSLSFVISCGKEDSGTQPVPGVLSIPSSSIAINEGESKQFRLSHLSGDKVNWTIADSPSWINVSPASGSISRGQSVEITIEPTPLNLLPLKLNGVIEIRGDSNQSYALNITVCLNAHPEMTLSASSVMLEEGNNFTNKVIITNTGSGTLDLTASTEADWLEILTVPFSVDVSQAMDLNIKTTVDINDLPPAGILNTTIKLDSNAETDPIRDIQVAYLVPEFRRINGDFNNLVLNLDTSSTFYITNTGNISSDWETMISDPLIKIEPASGTLEVGDTFEIEVTVDRENVISTQSNYTNIEFINPNDNSTYFNKGIEYITYIEEKALLDGQVLDAEYNQSLNQMVIVQNNPNSIVSYGDGGMTERLSLSYLPLAVSLSVSGQYAVVHGDSQFDLIDLNTMSIIKSESVVGRIDEIEVNDVGDVYVCVNNILKEYGINGMNQEITLSVSDVSGAKIHPNENFLYLLSNTDNTLIKINISNTNLEEEKVVNTDDDSLLPPLYKIWISDNGANLFTQSGMIYEIDASNNEVDLIFDRKLPINVIVDLDYSTTTNSMVLNTGIIRNNNEYEIEPLGPVSAASYNASTFVVDQGFIGPLSLVLNNGFYQLINNKIWYVGLNSTMSQYILVSSYESNNEVFWSVSTQPIN